MSDDDELNAELLALAGDDSASEPETTKAPAIRSKSPSPAMSAASASKKSHQPQSKRGAAPKKSMKTLRAGTIKVRSKDDSAEEGQASSGHSSPNSLGSGAMSVSDSDTSPDDAGSKGEDGAVFPVDGQFYSEKDKAEIMAMSEIKREEILAERAQDVERKTQDLHLRRLLQAREKDETKVADKKKRNANTAELEDSPRKLSRQKTKATENLEAYKRQREHRNEQRRRDDDRKGEKRSPLHDDRNSDADAEGESDVEWDDTARVRPARDEPQPELKDFERVRVGRSNFAKVCFYPGFDEVIKGCFCRVSIGVDKSTGQNQYRMTQVKGFTTGNLYAMEGSNGKIFHTNQYAIVAHGKAEKEWPFLTCSDSKFTEAEYEKYKQSIIADGLRTPPMSILGAKLDAIHGLLNRTWTDAEISERLKRSSEMHAKFISVSRDKLVERRERAIALDDAAAIARLDQDLAALDSGRPILGINLTNGATKALPVKAPTQQDRLAAINAANRKANSERIRKAQIAEKRAEQRARAAVARGEGVANPFARVKTKARIHHDAGNNDSLQVPSNKTLDELFGEGSDRSRAGTPGPGNNANTPKNDSTPRAGTPSGAKKTEKKPGLSTLKKNRNMDDEILSAMDFGIEIDI